jgi:hypothetical protein
MRKSENIVKKAFLSRGSRKDKEKFLVIFMTVIALNILIYFSPPASPASPASPAPCPLPPSNLLPDFGFRIKILE